MKLTLKIKGEKKKFSVPYFSTWTFRECLRITEEIDIRDVGIEELDALAAFVVEAFENQFTIDEYFKGTSKDEGLAIVGKILSICLHNVTEEEYDKAVAEDKEAAGK
jgi:hypothetical protein